MDDTEIISGTSKIYPLSFVCPFSIVVAVISIVIIIIQVTIGR